MPENSHIIKVAAQGVQLFYLVNMRKN